MPFNMLKDYQSFFTRALLILLAVTFVVGFGYVGGINIGGGPSGGTAVEVNGEKVPLSRFYNIKEALYRQYRQQVPDLPDDAFDFITPLALNNIVELKLMSQKARELGFKISDEELSESIKSNPSFQQDGKFVGMQRYKDFITTGLNQSLGEFEKGYKDELLARKWLALINETAKVTEQELLNLYKRENEQVNLYYISFTPEYFKSKITVGEDEIAQYYDNNKKQFLTSEQRKIKYLKLSVNDFKDKTQISDEEVKAYYNAYKDEFKTGDEIQTIDIAKSSIVDKLKDAKSSAYYSEFLQGLKDGDDIKSLDKLSSEFGTADVVETDYFTLAEPNADIPPEVATGAFSANKKGITFTTVAGSVWLIDVVDITDQSQKDLETVKDEITEILTNVKAMDKARTVADETLSNVLNSGDNLQTVSTTFTLKLNETGFFNKIDGPKNINNDEITFDAFSLKEKQNVAPKVYSASNSFYLFALKDKKGIDMEDFEKNKFLLKQQEIAKRQNSIARNALDKIRGEAKISPNRSLLQNSR